MPLFEVVVLQKDQFNENALEKIVYGPKAVIAKDREHAKNIAIKALDEKVPLESIQPLVRPFV